MFPCCAQEWTKKPEARRAPVEVAGSGVACHTNTMHRDVVCLGFAGVAQLVESELPKLVVAGSNPVARSTVRGLNLR